MLIPHVVWLKASGSLALPALPNLRSADLIEKNVYALARILGLLLVGHAGLAVMAVVAASAFRKPRAEAAIIERAPPTDFASSFITYFALVPPLLLVIVFVSVVGPSLGSVVAVIGILGWPGACRLVRGQLLSLREAEYVTAARVVGVSNAGILARHLIPNIVSSLAVLATFGVASAIILEAGLSFLGLGVKIPVPSWGEMINAAQSPSVLIDQPWLWISPGVAIALTVLAVNFIGDGLRDALDPKSTRRA
jgi:peptide/nickel transport system permease protein